MCKVDTGVISWITPYALLTVDCVSIDLHGAESLVRCTEIPCRCLSLVLNLLLMWKGFIPQALSAPGWLLQQVMGVQDHYCPCHPSCHGRNKAVLTSGPTSQQILSIYSNRGKIIPHQKNCLLSSLCWAVIPHFGPS